MKSKSRRLLSLRVFVFLFPAGYIVFFCLMIRIHLDRERLKSVKYVLCFDSSEQGGKTEDEARF